MLLNQTKKFKKPSALIHFALSMCNIHTKMNA